MAPCKNMVGREKLRQRDPGYFWWCLIDDTSWKISAFSTESDTKHWTAAIVRSKYFVRVFILLAI